MRHRHGPRKLNRTTSHRVAMLRNMTVSLLRHELIKTTLPKAKELRRVAEPIITLGKSPTLANKRLAFNRLRDATNNPIEMTEIEELIGRGKNQITMADVPIDRATAYAAAESEREALGIRFVSVLPQLTHATALGARYVAAYAAREGMDPAAFVARSGPAKATFVGGLRRARERRSGFNPHGQLVKALKADIVFRTGGSYLAGGLALLLRLLRGGVRGTAAP